MFGPVAVLAAAARKQQPLRGRHVEDFVVLCVDSEHEKVLAIWEK